MWMTVHNTRLRDQELSQPTSRRFHGRDLNRIRGLDAQNVLLLTLASLLRARTPSSSTMDGEEMHTGLLPSTTLFRNVLFGVHYLTNEPPWVAVSDEYSSHRLNFCLNDLFYAYRFSSIFGYLIRFFFTLGGGKPWKWMCCLFHPAFLLTDHRNEPCSRQPNSKSTKGNSLFRCIFDRYFRFDWV